MDTTITLPTDYATLIALLVNPLTMGIFLTYFLMHIPPIKDDKTTNWLKFVLAVVICLIWSFLVTIAKSGLPATPQSWYTLIYTGLAVAFANQGFYQVLNNIPALRDFLLAIFGKQTTIAASTSSGGETKTVMVEQTLQAKPLDTITAVG